MNNMCIQRPARKQIAHLPKCVLRVCVAKSNFDKTQDEEILYTYMLCTVCMMWVSEGHVYQMCFSEKKPNKIKKRDRETTNLLLQTIQRTTKISSSKTGFNGFHYSLFLWSHFFLITRWLLNLFDSFVLFFFSCILALVHFSIKFMIIR